jgi:hypothetical protein
MAQTYGIAAIGEQMAYEVLSYYKAQSGQLDELAEVLSDYDASADYWRVIKGKDGKVAKVIDDGDYEHINVYDATGKFEKRVGYQNGTSLVNAVMNAAEGLPAEKQGEPNWDRVNQVMVRSGLDYQKGTGWYAKTEEAKQAKERALAERQLETTVGIKNQILFEKAAQGISDLFSGIVNQLKPAVETWLSDSVTKFSRIFEFKSKNPVERTTDKYRSTAVSHLNEEYVFGVNDCDIWVEKISSEAGRDISSEWGVAKNSTVKDHLDLLGNKLKDKPNPGVNVFSQGDEHVGYIIVNPNGSVEIYHQGWNTGDIWESQRKEYPSFTIFESTWSKQKKYWPLTK